MHCNQLVYTLINDNLQIITLINKTPSFFRIILPKYFLFSFSFTRGKLALTARQPVSQSGCQLQHGVRALRKTTWGTNIRCLHHEEQKTRWATCQWLYNLQSVPNKFHSKSCGTRSFLKEYPVRRVPAAPFQQALVPLVFPGCSATRNARTQLLSLCMGLGSPQAGHQ